MVMPLPFTTTQQKLVNYDWTDIQDGTGIVTFYGGSIQVDGTTANNLYVLQKNIIPSAEVDGGEPQTYMTVGNPIDFDVSFNLPQEVQGNCIVVLSIAGSSAAGKPVLRLYHYDGTTETAISDAITLNAVGAAPAREVLIAKIPLTQTHFKSGDTFRFKLDAVDGIYTLWHDPIGTQTALWATTGGALKVYIPFLIQE